MNLPSLLVMSAGLAMDATAVAAARGLAVPRVPAGKALRMALIFGAFHVFMPLLGWGIGAGVGKWIQAYDHWIAFAVLGLLGGKMIHEAMAGDEQEEEQAPDPFRLSVVLPLAVGISLDALAVGFTLPLLGASMIPALASMGLVTALFTLLGVYAGRKFGAMLGKRLDIVGGLVLIGIGVKILVEHLSGAA